MTLSGDRMILVPYIDCLVKIPYARVPLGSLDTAVLKEVSRLG